MRLIKYTSLIELRPHYYYTLEYQYYIFYNPTYFIQLCPTLTYRSIS